MSQCNLTPVIIVPFPCLGWGPAQPVFTILANCRFISVATFVPWEGVRQECLAQLCRAEQPTGHWEEPERSRASGLSSRLSHLVLFSKSSFLVIFSYGHLRVSVCT